MNIFVGNVEPSISEMELKGVFSRFGYVARVTMVKDEDNSLQARGHCYVEMPSLREGNAAIAGTNGRQLRGQALSVIEAMPMSSMTSKVEKPRLGRRGRR